MWILTVLAFAFLLSIGLFWQTEESRPVKISLTILATTGFAIFLSYGYTPFGVIGLLTMVIIEIGLIIYLKANGYWLGS